MPDQPAVMSLNVQAALVQTARPQRQFEIMVRHLFDRMLNNEAFGEDAPARMTELAGAIALPGLLVALFLFPAYHHPPPLYLPRSLSAQYCDHLFFCTYSFVILGLAMVFQWDALFPDLLDVYVLTSLPIERRRMLWGRIAALAIFLGLVQIETSSLGTIFLPAVADLPLGFFHHLLAHAVAVTLSGAFAAAFFLALQGILACLPIPALANRLASAVKIVSVILLLTILFLFPLISSSIDVLLAPPAAIARLFPPFWFLGVYETILYGTHANPIFPHLAATAVWTTAVLAVIGAALYPFAYRRRVRQLVEGISTQRTARPAPLNYPIHALLTRTPAARAIFHFTAQTLARLPRLHLYLAMYAGVGLALILSEVLNFRTVDGHMRIVVPAMGIRMVFPLIAFWTVMGLRTALLSPLLLKGSWLFRVIDGTPREDGLRAARTLVMTIASTLILAATVIFHSLAPPGMRTVPTTLTELVLGLGLSLILTGLAFLPLRSIPFTTARVKAVHQLPIALVLYLVVFPFFALQIQTLALWDTPTAFHLLRATALFAAAHILLALARNYIAKTPPPRPEILYLGLGLRDE